MEYKSSRPRRLSMPKTVFSCPATIVVGKPMEGIQFIDRFSAFPPGIRAARVHLAEVAG